jgi:hypothetical protein
LGARRGLLAAASTSTALVATAADCAPMSDSRFLPLVAVPSGSSGALQYDLRTIEATQLRLPLFADEPPEPVDTVMPIRANVARVVTALAGLWAARGGPECQPLSPSLHP